MNKLPIWVLPHTQPAFFDSESATVIEQTGRVYAKMQELIDDYNKFVSTINQEIEAFKSETNADIETFKSCVTDITTNFISCVERKISEQDAKIQKTLKEITTNIESITNTIVLDAIRSGEIQMILNEEYNPNTESLNLSVSST